MAAAAAVAPATVVTVAVLERICTLGNCRIGCTQHRGLGEERAGGGGGGGEGSVRWSEDQVNLYTQRCE